MRKSPRTTPVGRSPRRSRRGVAMMLVIVALGAGTALAVTHLSTRSNASAIGANIQNSSQSEWSAKSAADLTEAILQTNIDWAAAASDGRLLDGVSIAGGAVEVFVTNLAGGPPSGQDVELLMTTVATVNGVRSVRTAVVEVQPPIANAGEAFKLDADSGGAEPDFTEFAVFAGTSFTVRGDGVLGVWDLSPASAGSAVAKIGGTFTSTAGLHFDANSNMRRGKFFPRHDASQALKGLINSGSFIGGGELPVVVPALVPKLPAFFEDLPWGNEEDRVVHGGETGTLIPGRRMSLRVCHGSVVDIGADGETTYVSAEEFEVNDALVVIRGEAHIQVRDDLNVRNGGAIQLAEGARVTFYVGDDIDVDDGVIGFPHALARNNTRAFGAVRSYRDPSRIRILMYGPEDGGDESQSIRFRNKGFVAASIHAPLASAVIEGASALFGRIGANTVEIRRGSALMYDPRFDRRLGLTELAGPLYAQNGALLEGLETALSAADWETFASLLATVEIPEPEMSVTGDATPRTASRAKSRPWPLRALLMELGGLPVVSVSDAGDDDDADDGRGGDGEDDDGGGIISTLTGTIGL